MAITSEAALAVAPTLTTQFCISRTSSSFTLEVPLGMTMGGSSIVTGYPGAFTFSTTGGVNGTTVDGTTNVAGTFPFTNPPSGSNAYLSGMNIAPIVANAGRGNCRSIDMFDMLWYNSGLSSTTTTTQTVNSVSLPPRDANGTSNGVGVIAWIGASSNNVITAANTTATISYTNSNGVAGQTGTIIYGFGSSANPGAMLPFSLAPGDVGVQSIQSVTLGTSFTSGPIALMLIRDIVSCGLTGSANGASSYKMDWSQLGLPQLYNGTALMPRITQTASGTPIGIVGSITVAYG